MAQIADRWEGYEPFIFSEEAAGADAETKAKIQDFAYDAAMILRTVSKELNKFGHRTLYVRINEQNTNIARVELNGRQYLIQVSPLNY